MAEILKTIGEITGINFIPHQSVSGTVTVMSPTPVPLGEIYPFLQSILDVAGYAAVETDNAVKIVPKAEASKRNLDVRIGADPETIPKSDTMVTQILPLKNGIDFLGFHTYLTQTGKVVRKVRAKSIDNMKRKIRKFRHRLQPHRKFTDLFFRRLKVRGVVHGLSPTPGPSITPVSRPCGVDCLHSERIGKAGRSEWRFCPWATVSNPSEGGVRSLGRGTDLGKVSVISIG